LQRFSFQLFVRHAELIVVTLQYKKAPSGVTSPYFTIGDHPDPLADPNVKYEDVTPATMQDCSRRAASSNPSSLVGLKPRLASKWACRGQTSMRTLNLEAGQPRVDEARRRLLVELEGMAKAGVTVLKVIHGWGSSGEGGKLGPAIRRSLRLRVKEGRARLMVTGERFSSDTLEGRELAQRHPYVRSDRDFNRANPGITVVELAR
jgi:hypothetical protein